MGNKNTDDILEMHDEQATMNWEFVDTDQLNHEISELTKKFNKVSSLITGFYDFTTANEIIKELYSKELTQAGKLLSFVVLNEEIFPGSLSDIKSFPKFYADLTPEKQKKYKELYEYWSFLKSLEPVCTKTCELLMSLPLLPGYKLSYIKSNLEEKGYSSSLYQQINSDALSLMEQVNQPWDSLESRANNNALPYLKQGFKERLSTRELEKYKKARSEDYKADVEKRCSFFRTSLTFSSNRFKLKPDIVPRMTVLDKYSYKLVEIRKNDFESEMNKASEKCKKILNEQLSVVEQFTKNEDCLYLIDSLGGLIESVMEFIDSSCEIYKGFKEANADSTPYCFMKTLPAFSKSSSKDYGFPLTSHLNDPWDNGTDYARLYLQAEFAINLHYDKFMKNHDNMIKR